MNSNLTPYASLKLTALAALQDNFSASDLTNPRASYARQMHRHRKLLETKSVARRRLPFGEMLRFEQWLMREIEAKFRTREFRARLDILHETPQEVVPLPLYEAAQVVLQLLGTNHLGIVDQLNQAARVHRLISEERLDEALAALEEHRRKHGATFWSAETQIAITNVQVNPEEVRRLQRRLGGNRGGLIRFFLSAAATRSDSAQLGTRQLAFLSRRIKNSVLSDKQKLHVQYRAAGMIPSSEEDIATVLSYELLLPALDVVLSALVIGYSVVAQQLLLDERATEAFLALLKTYGEPHFGVPVPKAKSDHGEALVCSALAAAIEGAVHGLLSSSDYRPMPGQQGLEGAIGGQLVGDDASAREWLPHFVASFPHHPWAIQVKPALPLRTLAELSHDLAEQREPRNQSPVRAEIAREFIARVGTHAEPAFALLLEDGQAGSARRLVGDSAYLRRLDDLSKPARECLEIILSWSLFHDNQLVDALGVCLRLGLTNARLVEATPLVPLFEGRSWKHLKGLGDLLELSCALQLYHGAAGDSNAKTSKRFAVAALMSQEGCKDLASLVRQLSKEEDCEPRLLDFFITQVIDLPLIELLVDVQTTEAAQQELISVLQAAADLGGHSAAAMSARVAEIEQAIAVAQTKGAIDATKVVVGESELFQKALQEYRSTYDHVQKLVKDRPSEEVDFDALLRLRPSDLSSDVSDSPERVNDFAAPGVMNLLCGSMVLSGR